MDSPRTGGHRGAVIIALRPDLVLDSQRRRVDLEKSAADAREEISDRPYQLSLFDPSLFDPSLFDPSPLDGVPKR